MNMKKISFFVAVFCLAQLPVMLAQTYDQLNTQLQFLNHYGKAYQRGSLAPQYVGSEYFNDQWMPMDIKFKDTLLRFDAVKINLMNSNLEVLFNNEEKVIANYYFEYVLIPEGDKKRLFVPAQIFKFDNAPLAGFVEVYGTGESKVLVNHYIFIRQPHAQAHITGGYTMDRLMKETENFLYSGSKLTVVKRKKDLQDYYSRKKSTLERYFKEHNPNIKDPQQLLMLMEKMSAKG